MGVYDFYDAEWARETFELEDRSPDEFYHRATIMFEALMNGHIEPTRTPSEGHVLISFEVPMATQEVEAMQAILQIMDGGSGGVSLGMEARTKLRIAQWFLSWAKEQVQIEQEQLSI